MENTSFYNNNNNTTRTSPKRRGSPSKRRSSPSGCRFIPNRSSMDMDVSHFNVSTSNSSAGSCDTSPSRDNYKSSLCRSLFKEDSQGMSSKILSFKEKAPAPPQGHENSMKVLYSQNKSAFTAKPKSYRHIAQVPEKILDAPDMLDDYYLNLLDWSSDNVLAVALGQTCYLWNASSGSIEELTSVTGENYITSVNWVAGGGYLGVGTAEGETHLYDAETMQLKRSMDGHSARVSSLSWNNHIISSGGRDSLIINHDVRVRNHAVQTLSGTHEAEICGLKWSPDGSQLASGGNDNLMCVWEMNSEEPKFSRTDHTAAVKALAWCPWQNNLLASGGGTSDRKIRFWNTSTGACLNTIDTHSQVCSILWSKHQKELISSHGFSQNQLIVWKYPTMEKMAELTGHTSRVLHMAMSPDGNTVVSAAGDETLRFWKVFENSASNKSKAKGSRRTGVNGSRKTFGSSCIR